MATNCGSQVRIPSRWRPAPIGVRLPNSNSQTRCFNLTAIHKLGNKHRNISGIDSTHHPRSSADLKTYFAMARGIQSTCALEMTKRFDTNYHYIAPEFGPEMEFRLNSDKPLNEFLEAKALGFQTRPVVLENQCLFRGSLGPVSFALLGKCTGGQRNRLDIARPGFGLRTVAG